MKEDAETLEELLILEKKLVSEAAEKYGAFWKNAADFNDLIHSFLKEASPEAHLFALFLSQIKKHHTLALISFVRRHEIQAQMDMRQTIEAACAAAYSLAHTRKEDFIVESTDGTINEPESLRNKRYKWLETHFRKHSDFLKNQKGNINKGPAHSTITYAFPNFDLAPSGDAFEFSFLDREDEFHIKLNLWFAGNLAMGILDLFLGVNMAYPLLKFQDDFVRRLKELEAENHKLKAELGTDSRITKWLPE